MPPLDPSLRKALDSAVVKARDEAEKAASAALIVLGVEAKEAPPSLSEDDRRLRVALRAKKRQLEDDFELLIQDLAYEQWHRILFARFLAENNLLMHPSGVHVTLDECAELAADEGEADRWQVAAKYASLMLPGIFREDDPCVKVRFAPEGRQALEAILDSLPPSVFTADDSLGWVYQFWQTKRKDEINERADKIGGADLAPVTQLFTEHYMVAFLLENSLGAWWASRRPNSPLIKEFTFLRFAEDGTPAAEPFEWPETAKQVTVMDPCCGSGHFLVTAFDMLRKMRMEEEGLYDAEAGDAVIRENIFGLELDPRCTQLAAFALALAAWKSGGYRPLPLPNIACSGIAVTGQLQEWKRLAKGNEKLEAALEQLYMLFRNAPDLGSLINPRRAALRDDLLSIDYSEVAPLLEEALSNEHDDPALAVFGAAAAGTARAAQLLSETYTLVATNVPYLSRYKQEETLRAFSESSYPDSKADLATTFLERIFESLAPGGLAATVTPQNWMFLGAYERFRVAKLTSSTWHLVCFLGAGAFETISGVVVNVVLSVLGKDSPRTEHVVFGLDASQALSVQEKKETLKHAEFEKTLQAALLANPDARIVFGLEVTEELLGKYADSRWGLRTADVPRFVRKFWEFEEVPQAWERFQGSVDATQSFGGREDLLLWESGSGTLKHFADIGLASLQGADAWGKEGVAVSLAGNLPVTLYTGEKFANSVAALWPFDPKNLLAIWAFCSSPDFATAVRRLDKKLIVTNQTLMKVPFDFEKWRQLGEAQCPNGLPEPFSRDVTQWLFNGHPKASTRPLHVAVARLLGYRWPDQRRDKLDSFTDTDGIACIPPVAGESPAAERIRSLLASAFGEEWSNNLLDQLIKEEGGKDLATWLRDKFFESHCRLFHQRPLIWHIWDGKKDGFSALVNYHKLDRATLDKLIYIHLRWWINSQKAEAKAGKTGAEPRLAAGIELQRKLEAIREGEAPYDIYVRWKDISEQPIGWEPDLNDGVRLNIRPFVKARVLRWIPNIKWNKDRGKEPDGSDRINDKHLTLAEKRARREGRA